MLGTPCGAGHNDSGVVEAVRRSGWLPGELNGAAKLTADKVLAIRRDTRVGKLIAYQYGISLGHVSRIRRGRKWKHLASPQATQA